VLREEVRKLVVTGNQVALAKNVYLHLWVRHEVAGAIDTRAIDTRAIDTRALPW